MLGGCSIGEVVCESCNRGRSCDDVVCVVVIVKVLLLLHGL